MSLNNLRIDLEYRTDEHRDIGHSFIVPALKESTIYKRCVGFFSSSALLNLSEGLSYLSQKDNSHIYLVASPILYKEDVEAIKKGYQNRSNIVEKALIRQIKGGYDEFDSERLNFLCHLIENGILDIKIADMDNIDGESIDGIYHEKFGLFEDEEGNYIGFSGSLNESETALSRNFEHIMTFTSWKDPERIDILKRNFDNLWNNKTRYLNVYDFPKAVKEELFKYRKNSYHSDLDEYIAKKKKEKLAKLPSYNFPYPLHPYQKEAINNWASHGFKGIFDMGTGTGKTVTAYAAIVGIYNRIHNAKQKLGVIILCPQLHLVNQWVEDAKFFNINFIIADSQYSYEEKLKQAIYDFNNDISDNFFLITTNASYCTTKLQTILSKINSDSILFVADEAHNLGAYKISRLLNPKYKYRLALSATIDRHNDDEGTNAIRNYFGDVVIHYGLKEAIRDGFLTRYFYYPIPVFLTDDEQERYKELTSQISRCLINNGGKKELSEKGKKLAIQRARLIATAENKLQALKEEISDQKNENNILVYCGSGSNEIQIEDKDISRQIDLVTDLLGNQLNMSVSRYTSRETPEVREDIKNDFQNRKIQALIAIKCLDEGVNIPSIQKAYILASSTNPREYIQRRGRVLRLFKGKKYAYIYDFITLPYLNEEREDANDFVALAKNEINRIKEFSSLSENASDSAIMIKNITSTFGLDQFKESEDFEFLDNWED